MKRTLQTMLCADIFGRKVIRLDRKTDILEICKNGNHYEIVVCRPYCRCTAWKCCGDDFLLDIVPTFPNMMQAYRYLKENWIDII